MVSTDGSAHVAVMEVLSIDIGRDRCRYRKKDRATTLSECGRRSRVRVYEEVIGSVPKGLTKGSAAACRWKRRSVRRSVRLRRVPKDEVNVGSFRWMERVDANDRCGGWNRRYERSIQRIEEDRCGCNECRLKNKRRRRRHRR